MFLSGGGGVTVDAANDVIAGGRANYGSGPSDAIVVKLAGATGGELWRLVLSGSNYASWLSAVAVDPSNDVIAAGTISCRGIVVKIEGNTGSVLWQRAVQGTPGCLYRVDSVGQVAVDRAGDVIVNATTTDGNVSHATIVKFAGSSGNEIWRRTVDGTAPALSQGGGGLALTALGDVIAAAATSNIGSGSSDFTVARLSGSTGSETWRMARTRVDWRPVVFVRCAPLTGRASQVRESDAGARKSRARRTFC